MRNFEKNRENLRKIEGSFLYGPSPSHIPRTNHQNGYFYTTTVIFGCINFDFTTVIAIMGKLNIVLEVTGF